jgi:hypothetical protein
MKGFAKPRQAYELVSVVEDRPDRTYAAATSR